MLRKREEIMKGGVTLKHPQTVFFSHDTVVENDVVIDANVVFGPKVHVKTGTVIHSFCHIEVGEGVNIGAGTITCNYDGFDKHKTRIGAGAFIGTNSSLVAPLTIGRGAYLGSGGVITSDVPDDALAVARADQVNKAGWAARYRQAKAKRKAPKE